MRSLVIAVSVALLSACGGGSSDSQATGNTAISPAPSIQPNGIYKSDDAVMIIDTEITHGVLAADSSNNLYLFDTATVNNDTLDLKGIHLWSNSISFYNASQTASLTFNDNTASVMATIDSQSFVHTFVKQPDSLSLNQLIGTHTNTDDGSTWDIDSAGNITINGMCTFSGTLTNNDHYFKVSMTATACSPTSYNGNYDGAAFTVDDNGITQFVGALYSDAGIVWGTVPVN